jgi:phage-related protein (TIGR01555 family)
MGILSRFTDGLANLASGLGTSADKRSGSFYHLCLKDASQIDAAYRSSWLIRKIVDIPAMDMTRERRDWQADQADIEKLEAEEKRLQLWAKVRQALILGRLGGGAIIMGVGREDPALPINPKSLKAGSLRYVHVVSRYRLTVGPIVMDPESDLFGQPEYFQLGGQGTNVRIHPSRVVAFKGMHVPDLGMTASDQWFWGDSIIQVIDEAVKNADTATGGFASLIHEAKVDTVSIPGLIEHVATKEGEALIKKRVEIANMFKSAWNTRILDGGTGEDGTAEEWDTRQINWAGMPDVMNAFMGFVAGAADIPATRLLGRSPQGMNATGESDLTNYYDGLQARQDMDLRPQLEQIDRVLIPSAGVAVGDEAKTWFEFPPLTTPTEQEEATTFNTSMDAVTKLQNTGLIPDVAMSKAVQNFMTERGYLPGLEGALEEIPESERFPEPADDEPDPNALTQEGGDPSTGAKGGSPKGKTPFVDYNPAQRRDRNGRWTSGGGSARSIVNFVAAALGAPGENGSHEIGQADGITPKQFHGYARRLKTSSIQHTMLEHGNRGVERARGQLAITRSDFGKIPRIVSGAHKVVTHGSPGSRRPMSLEYVAKLGKRTYHYVEIVGTKRQQLTLKTMWKK